MKYIKSLLCIILVAVLLSGCSFRLASSVNDLISAISPFGDNADIKLAMDNYLGNGYTHKNPTSGDYITSYNFYDLDGQGGLLHEGINNDNAEYNIIDTPGQLTKDTANIIKE